MIKDKSFNPTSLLLLIIVLITNTGESLQAQKRPLDIDACMSWNRIDVPSLSPGGQWVTYKITSIEFTENHKYQNSVFLYDTETGEETILDNASDLQFIDNDKLLTYQYEHEEGKPETIIMDLKTLDKKVWKHDEKFNPYIGTSLSVVKDKDVADQLIIRN